MNGAPTGPHWWLLRYLRPEWPALSAGGAVMIMRAMVLLAIPWPMKGIVDNVIFQHPLDPWLAALLADPRTHRLLLLNELALIMLGLGGLDALLVYAGNRTLLNAGQRVMFAVRFDLFSHLQRLPLAFHRSRRSGDLNLRMSEDVKQLQDFIASLGIDLLPHVVTVLGMAVVMLLLDWRYALLTLAAAPPLVLITVIFSRRLRRAVREVRQHDGTLNGIAQEILACVQVVQAFSREAHEEERFSAQADKSLRAGRAANRIQAQFGAAMGLAIIAVTALITWYGALRVVQGELSTGELLVFLAYLRGFAAPARQLAKTGRVSSRALIAMERIGECRATRSTIVERPDALAPEGPSRRISVREAGFGYRPGHTVLRDISFDLTIGRMVALAGATGSGKTTIASLVARFYDPQSGAVLFDGIDIRDLKLCYVRRQVALVPQEPALFQATIWENIAYGRQGAGREEALAAAREAGLQGFLDRLPDGIDTPVGERGSGLSGGQRQCVAIARALLSEAPVVILDEPTSSLDVMTERQLSAAVARLSRQRAVLIIAHRLSTITRADEILLLDQGRIIERGSHDELRKRAGAYARLWSALQNDQATSLPRAANQ
jgi:ATP-binding cassette subfamily B protein/subfamily B ATP-binding cassette protein MsbA